MPSDVVFELGEGVKEQRDADLMAALDYINLRSAALSWPESALAQRLAMLAVERSCMLSVIIPLEDLRAHLRAEALPRGMDLTDNAVTALTDNALAGLAERGWLAKIKYSDDRKLVVIRLNRAEFGLSN